MLIYLKSGIVLTYTHLEGYKVGLNENGKFELYVRGETVDAFQMPIQSILKLPTEQINAMHVEFR